MKLNLRFRGCFRHGMEGLLSMRCFSLLFKVAWRGDYLVRNPHCVSRTPTVDPPGRYPFVILFHNSGSAREFWIRLGRKNPPWTLHSTSSVLAGNVSLVRLAERRSLSCLLF